MSNNSTAGKDATEYYGAGHNHDKMRKMGSKHIYEVEEMKAELIGECYIGFQKLLNEELKAFDLKDSVFFDTLKGTGQNLTGSGNATGKTKPGEQSPL